jgi:hypothetical protein
MQSRYQALGVRFNHEPRQDRGHPSCLPSIVLRLALTACSIARPLETLGIASEYLRMASVRRLRLSRIFFLGRFEVQRIDGHDLP